jgi:hypothetical protein
LSSVIYAAETDPDPHMSALGSIGEERTAGSSFGRCGEGLVPA